MAHSRKRSFRAPNVRFGPEQPREPWGVGRIAPLTGANRSTHWCESLHPLVRIAPPRPPRRSARLGRTNGAATHQPPHPRRPQFSTHADPHQPDRSPPLRPGFWLPDSGSWWQTAPWSPRWMIGLPIGQKKGHQPEGFSKPEPPPVCQQSGQPGLPSNLQGDHKTDVHSNHHRTHNRPDQFSPDHNPTHQQPDNPTRTVCRQQTPHHNGRRSPCLHVAGREKDPRPRSAKHSRPSIPCRS